MMIILSENTKRTIHNEDASLTVDLFGGALTDFHLHQDEINPLSFSFSKEQMPENNKGGATYQGHFLCLGRWGEPSAGEMKAGMPNHGQVANILWKGEGHSKNNVFKMQVSSPLEGLHVDRTIKMDSKRPVYEVKEIITNTNPLGRLYNMVQHPTLAATFLDHATIVNCNAEEGFNYVFSKNLDKHVSVWPYGIGEDFSRINLSKPEKACNSVFSFIVKKANKLGWISAYSPKFNVVLGYIWKRSNYPWINLWLDWSENQIRYRGLEFGTTGMHKPFHQILEEGNIHLFGEKTFEFIDAGEKVARSYISFLHKVGPGYKGINDIKLENGKIIIQETDHGKGTKVDTILTDLDELQ